MEENQLALAHISGAAADLLKSWVCTLRFWQQILPEVHYLSHGLLNTIRMRRLFLAVPAVLMPGLLPRRSLDSEIFVGHFSLKVNEQCARIACGF